MLPKINSICRKVICRHNCDKIRHQLDPPLFLSFRCTAPIHIFPFPFLTPHPALGSAADVLRKIFGRHPQDKPLLTIPNCWKKPARKGTFFGPCIYLVLVETMHGGYVPDVEDGGSVHPRAIPGSSSLWLLLPAAAPITTHDHHRSIFWLASIWVKGKALTRKSFPWPAAWSAAIRRESMRLWMVPLLLS